MISVIIPLYNKERYIKRAICSVLNQSFGNFEIVVINDGSTDNSASIVESIDDTRIKLINQKNTGVSAARNKGIAESKYDFIAFLDADDEWKENHLAIIASLIEKYPLCGVFATSYYFLKKG
ncbi:MAG: glycosyltransferase family A protein, partial [Bacteroidaceae bacterium]